MPLPRLHSVTALFHGQGLRALALRGAVWTVLGFGLSNLLRLGSSLALTRILAPDIFGLMALAMVFVTGLTLLSDVGTTASVVRSDRGEDPSFLRTVWTVQVLRGLPDRGHRVPGRLAAFAALRRTGPVPADLRSGADPGDQGVPVGVPCRAHPQDGRVPAYRPDHDRPGRDHRHHRGHGLRPRVGLGRWPSARSRAAS